MPLANGGVTPRARALAAAIREVRERCGMSGRELCNRLGVSHGMVSHWETGRRVPNPEDVASFLTAVGISGDEKERLINLARNASEPNWLTVGVPGTPQQLAGSVQCERSATSIVEWAPMGLPGLLQTADYARAIATASGMPSDDVETRVMLRIGRREILTRRDPVHLTALVGEHGLRDRIGATGVMPEQLRYLHELTTRSNIEIRVVREHIGWHPGLAGPFVLYDFPDSPPVVHFEHYSSGAFVPDSEDIRAYRNAVDEISKLALSPTATAELIATIAKETEDAEC